jgi:branched-chain amino acid transport system ATP-binding protein
MMSLLETRGLTRAFGSLIAINDVSLAVEPGELRAVIGPNGAGKTTFFNLISGLFPPTRGSIFFNGQDITRLSANKRVALGVSRTFQVTEIFPELTVSENLMIAVESAAGLRLSPWLSRATRRRLADRVVELLVAGGLVGKGTRLAGELSHGDQRATEIMMALALKPVLLLLDEPTAGMSAGETHDTIRLLERIAGERGLTLLFTEHDMDVVFSIAQKIAVLHQGRLIADGSPQEVRNDPEVRRVYLGHSH